MKQQGTAVMCWPCAFLWYIKMAVAICSKFEITLEDLMSKYEFSLEDLDKECSDNFLNEFEKYLKEWELVAPLLGVSVDYVRQSESKPELQRRKCLLTWKRQSGYKSTYLSLLEALLNY